MSPGTLKALQGSIEKWEAIVAGTGVDNATDNCPLCVRFYDNRVRCERRGELCPVYKTTGEPECWTTPYFEWRKLFDHFKGLRADNKARKAAAQKEVDFLKSLLPENAA